MGLIIRKKKGRIYVQGKALKEKRCSLENELMTSTAIKREIGWLDLGAGHSGDKTGVNNQAKEAGIMARRGE